MDNTILKKKISSAPDDIKDLISSFDIVDLVDKITLENNLSHITSTNLGQEIVRILVGFTKLTALQDKLMSFGLPENTVKKISSEVEEKIFSKVKDSLEKVQSSMTSETVTETHPDKDTILKDIENPAPVTPVISNPAGKNPILDAQHNLPVGEPKKLISSAAVPSRGPILNSVNTSFAVPKATPTTTIPEESKPLITPITTTQPIVPQKPPQEPIPPAPSKYSVDPYREPIE